MLCYALKIGCLKNYRVFKYTFGITASDGNYYYPIDINPMNRKW